MPLVYVGIAWRMAWSIISFPATNKNFDFQLDILCQVLSSKDWKSFDLDLPMIAGSPRYLSREMVAQTPEFE